MTAAIAPVNPGHFCITLHRARELNNLPLDMNAIAAVAQELQPLGWWHSERCALRFYTA
jgi:hypothetical protein